MAMAVLLTLTLSITASAAALNPARWIPSEQGYTGFIKPVWFGANSSGLDSEAQLALMAKFAVAGYGWQTGNPTGGSLDVGRGDAWSGSAVTNARNYMDSIGNSKTMLFQYRQFQVALGLFAQPRIAAVDPTNKEFWLQSPNGTICTAQQPWGTSDPFWNFTNANAVDYWVDHVIGQLATDSAMTGLNGRGAVFFDETDQGYCGYRYPANCDPSTFDLATLQRGNNAMLAATVAKLNSVGITPILSLDNRITASSDGLPGAALPCAIPEEDTIAALQGLKWVRFYETWPSSFWVQKGPDLDAAMIQNAIIESSQYAVDSIVHGFGHAEPRNIPRPGRLGGTIEFLIATYLIITSPGTTLSISTGWMDKDYSWAPEFDIEYGTPKGPATRIDSHSWSRNFTKCNVFINVSDARQQVGIVDLL
eukprot:m.125889 g.125889  ORF g.125889 m.125889 type:complete len:421 (+) comp29163_c0_seq1:61-1323(+)